MIASLIQCLKSVHPSQVRKRAVLALFKIFERYPEAVKTGVARLRDRLEDDDPGEKNGNSAAFGPE